MAIFSRIGRMIRGFFGLFVSGMEERNPEALMEVARQEFRDRMAQYNQAMARLAGIAERLKSQIKVKGDRAKDLETRVLTNHRVGNLDLAGSLARELAELKADVQHDMTELEDTEQAYQAALENARLSQKEFEEKIRRLERQLSQVKVKEAQAEAASALGNVAFKVGDLGDTMKTVEEVLQKRYEASAGKARVAADLVDRQEVQARETERKALEQVALADFLASQGIAASDPTKAPPQSTPPTSQGTRDMGPGQSESV